MSDFDQELQRLIAMQQCEQTILHFTAYFDAGEYLEMERYFSTDGVWKYHGGDICGVEQLRERMAARKPDRLMRHVISNMRVTLHSPEHATSDSYVTLYMHVHGDAPPPVHAPLSGPIVVGRYRDELRRIAGAWKIQVRHPVHDFKCSP
ncbi:SnoaL-like domain-containing protein [Variovorax sp. PDC80]|uniref:nuclear transport factor 2 family protein n=1 Tax=Variovorax sp. PDC80 TaxID=1882827 RepID=UPI0008F2CEB3|nr:nuclear transport factor 2 family protein [Variovorax sp. PDC80]SFN99177.1 SnoaL-like domain-containing protein [Variovorax sp. PDC80]